MYGAGSAAHKFEAWCEPRPSWISYEGFLEFARAVRRDLHDMRPRDMIDIQSFMWVLGSEEYKE